ncbi:MAG: hypothetical protein FWC12_12000 [Treponema sp.]|nr:hypothetical protein [Treponema sp.]
MRTDITEKLTFEDGAVYEGDMHNDKEHGKGKLTFADGRVQEGNWKDGEFIGNSCEMGGIIAEIRDK